MGTESQQVTWQCRECGRIIARANLADGDLRNDLNNPLVFSNDDLEWLEMTPESPELYNGRIICDRHPTATVDGFVTDHSNDVEELRDMIESGNSKLITQWLVENYPGHLKEQFLASLQRDLQHHEEAEKLRQQIDGFQARASVKVGDDGKVSFSWAE